MRGLYTPPPSPSHIHRTTHEHTAPEAAGELWRQHRPEYVRDVDQGLVPVGARVAQVHPESEGVLHGLHDAVCAQGASRREPQVIACAPVHIRVLALEATGL